MSDHMEEQEMEAEALAAIFDTAFEQLSDSSNPPIRWSVKLIPVDCGGDEEEEEAENHVAVKLLATLPDDYPEFSLPDLNIEVLKGLAEDQRQTILQIANDEAEANQGMPMVFAVCEAVRAWLADNNVKGLDDGSMHAQMMRKMKEAEKSKAQAKLIFETQRKEEEMTAAEMEDLEVRKRRAEGTPCNAENFAIWKQKFDVEMEEKKEEQLLEEEQRDKSSGGKKKGACATDRKKEEDVAGRMTGFEYFTQKTGGALLNMDDIEKAAEEVESRSFENDADLNVDNLDVDEELFDDEDDLDDLDFDSDEEED
eukprot:CAMPEP_0184864112 /NCGR_PEP_ID=MMETSP0580-20130426/13821_1 /TAXON_ID=1118495 /ORGANISM="Dactyliosolen fragilissimus" /LENGTH=310 /DNA_ID=CAMNT_0027362765 /DNA_START=148 /DNA_END=1080 /DNA_ORIENTATION=+